jgi:membrane protease YdiL (CAAX protease family)
MLQQFRPFSLLGYLAGWSAVADLGRRLIAWRIGWRWYTVIVAIPLAIAFATSAIFGILGGQFSAALPVSFELPIPLALLIIVIRTLTDGVGEETAWRGVALPGLLTRMNPVAASLVLGVIWAAWHLPLFFTKGSVMANDSIPLLFILLPAESVVYTWLY